ncbi:SGNH/GDSL hydrolase family protein [Paenibacillus sacheonensis]|uniref:SGNH hydrolase-type esterase domain-containing protein n=1 Tax=Paenibacillus sacheonensis TaxID=742054 RepID=A0A7X4YMZ9_9BACL|nr:SGNH/GDSL hydrolase family protein [Paenibacillus sacheonensis]MBM7564817.1 lysophospholipase L1-like esterase [Paenibacillus sacheonensis]NBC69365.1 hypothetical protein [Paenibacillus sacheonensis]
MQSSLKQDGQVPDSLKVVFLGDSITENGTYITMMQDYLTRQMPHKRVELMNHGLSSETVSGLSEPDHPFPRPCVLNRVRQALEQSKPDWVVACYGMNDGIYYPFSNERFDAYKQGMLKLIETIGSYGAKVIVMTPPPFDSRSISSDKLLPDGKENYSYMEPYQDYTSVLRQYGTWIKAELVGAVDQVVDVYAPLSAFIAERRNQQPDFVYGDGIHPDGEGHGVMAKTLLEELFDCSFEDRPTNEYERDRA